MHIRCQSRHRSHQLPHWNSQPQRRERGFISFSSLEINLNLCSKFRWLDLMNQKSFRCICFGFHPVEPSSFARVCSRILTKYGTSVRVRSINGFSPLFFPLVTVWFLYVLRLINTFSSVLVLILFGMLLKVSHMGQQYGKFQSCMAS